MKRISLSVPEIHCAACEHSIRNALATVAGVGEVHVDLSSRSVAVGYDEQLTTDAAIRSRIESAGFDVEADGSKGAG